MKDAFVKELLAFFKSSRCKAVLLLSGVDLSNRTDSQMLYVSIFPELISVA